MINICGHRILVKQEKLEDVDPVFKRAKDAGIQIASSDRTTQAERKSVDKGVVVSIGSTAFKDLGGEAWCKVGDMITFVKYGGYIITDPETKEDFVALNDEDVLAIVKG